ASAHACGPTGSACALPFAIVTSTRAHASICRSAARTAAGSRSFGRSGWDGCDDSLFASSAGASALGAGSWAVGVPVTGELHPAKTKQAATNVATDRRMIPLYTP